MELQPGTFLQDGRYQIVGVIGQGGFGITYKALQPALDRYVAIKEFFMKKLCEREGNTSRVTVPTESAREEAGVYRAKFLKEARTIASFSHPNIVRIHDIFEENNTAYYVMEFLDGGSLSEAGALPQKQALEYIRQIGDALQYMHERKTMHLDVKPGNIMLRADGTAVLIDFGISKHYDASDGETSRTPVGISKGYAPAEQYREGGVSTFSPTSDVYSLAATLYKLLTGITPPESIDLQSGEAELAPYPSGVSEICKQAIACALRPRKERPQTMDEFLRLLDVEANGDATQLAEGKKKPSSEGKHPSGKPSGTMRVVLGLVALVVVALLVYLLGHNKGREGNEIASPEEEVRMDLLEDIVSETEPLLVEEVKPVPVKTNVQPAEDENTATSVQVKPEPPKRYKGTLTLNDGTYEGEILEGQPDGYGVAKYKNGNVYEGEWKNGVLSGNGVYTWSYGDKYEGGFANGTMHGQGTYTWVSGNKYVGMYENGKMNGKGTYTTVKGDKYVGDFKDDLKSGYGIYTWSYGDQYEGEFANGTMHGQGTYIWANGNKYVGAYENGKKNGKGIFTWLDGRKYEGMFKDDVRNGQGVHYLSDGSVWFSGQWADDKPVR